MVLPDLNHLRYDGQFVYRFSWFENHCLELFICYTDCLVCIDCLTFHHIPLDITFEVLNKFRVSIRRIDLWSHYLHMGMNEQITRWLNLFVDIVSMILIKDVVWHQFCTPIKLNSELNSCLARTTELRWRLEINFLIGVYKTMVIAGKPKSGL